MKVIVSGGTGYIGSEVLTHCLNHPSVTSVLILTRRDPGNLSSNPKARVIIIKDFTSYDDNTINELRTADAALWCLGTTSGDEKIDIEFPLTFINIIKTRPPGSKQFRYVQLSGAFTEPPPKDGQQERALWFYTNGRRVRGLTEAKVLETSDNGPESQFIVYAVKPGAVLPQEGVATLLTYILSDSLCIKINELAAAMVDLAVNGNEQKLFSNKELIAYGKRILNFST